MSSQTLPPQFYSYFWDVNPETMDITKYFPQVIARLLDLGDTHAVRWVFSSYPKEKIIYTLNNYRDISRKTGLFWQQLLNIPRKDIACLQIPYRQIRFGV